MFQLCYYVAQGHIPYRIVHVFVTTHLLAMTKPFGSVYHRQRIVLIH
jgi:hypothetical protein